MGEIDRLYVCKKPTDQRTNMGHEFNDIKLVDVYVKNKPHRITQKYSGEFLIRYDFQKGERDVIKAPEFKE